MSFFRRLYGKKNTNIICPDEEKRLHLLPRYVKTETSFLGRKFIINDACTFICDVNEIIINNIYLFPSKDDSPVIIDCGSNIGVSVIFFKKNYKNAKIFSFEPDPILFDMLSKNILNFSLNNVTLHQSAVWINNYGVNFLTEGGHSGKIVENKNSEKKEVVLVQSIRLKDFIESFEKIDMLKIDIEGVEKDVIFDCGESLKRCRNIFVEYHASNKKKLELHDILNMLSDFGYRYHIKEAFVRKRPFVDRNCLLEMEMQLNIFFYKA